MKAVFSLEMTGDFQPLFPDGCSDVFISTGQYMFFMGSEIGDLKLQQQGLPMEGLLLVTSVQFFSVFHWRSCLCTTKSIQLCKVKTVWTILTQLTNPPPILSAGFQPLLDHFHLMPFMFSLKKGLITVSKYVFLVLVLEEFVTKQRSKPFKS